MAKHRASAIVEAHPQPVAAPVPGDLVDAAVEIGQEPAALPAFQIEDVKP